MKSNAYTETNDAYFKSNLTERQTNRVRTAVEKKLRERNDCC